MKRQILLGVVVVALTVIGCSSAATPLPTPAPAPMAFPTGTFTMQLGNHQWTMLLGENGNCTLVEDDVIVSTGVYKVTGDQLEWLQTHVLRRPRRGARHVHLVLRRQGIDFQANSRRVRG
jgi:hypothetical protein